MSYFRCMQQVTRQHFVQLLYVFSRVGANATVTIVAMVSHAGIVTIVLSRLQFFVVTFCMENPSFQVIFPPAIPVFAVVRIVFSLVNHCHIGEGTHSIWGWVYATMLMEGSTTKA